MRACFPLLENLLGNAWKLRPASGSRRTRIFVRDNGAGFDMADADLLFEPFHRLHPEVEFARTGMDSRPFAPIRRDVSFHVARDFGILVSLLGTSLRLLVAEGSEEAVALWRAGSFDAATVDLLLPDTSGVELAREGRNFSVPIIVVTVVPDARVVAGFAVHDILGKPLDRESLLASLVRAGVCAEERH